MSYRLCFTKTVDESAVLFFFTDKFKTQWGDDWRKHDWKQQAGEPYVWKNDRDDDYNQNCGHIRVIAAYFEEYPDIEYPHEGYSVEEINKGRVAWAYSAEHGPLQAKATMAETFKFLSNFKCLYGELKQIGKGGSGQDADSNN